MLTLGEFLETPSPAPVSSWADEMDKVDGDSGTDHTTTVAAIRAQLPTAPKSAQALDIPDEKIPKVKPFRVYISSVSFEADEDMVRRFFAPLKVESVHLVRNERGTGHRGFGHVDFDDRESLIESLGRTDTKLHTRNVRITIEEPRSDRGAHHQHGGQQQHPSGPLKSDEANWRRTEPEHEPEPEQHSRYSSASRGGRGGSRGAGRGGFSGENRRGGYHHRQQGDEEGENRRGGYHHRQQGDEEGENRRGGYHHRQQGDEEGGYQRRPYNKPRGAGGERTFQHRERAEPEQQHNEEETPQERPKLHLQPRSKPIEPEVAQVASSIFGGAKPVDTAARERAIEEKLKAEREEKARKAAEAGEDPAAVEAEKAPVAEAESHEHEEKKEFHERRSHPEGQQFYSAKAKHFQNDGNNNTRVSSGARRGGYKGGEGKMVKSPSGDSGAWKKAGEAEEGDEGHRGPRTFVNRERRGGGVGGGKDRRGGGASGKYGGRPGDRGGEVREKKRAPQPETLRDETPSINLNNKFAFLNCNDEEDNS